MSRPIVSIIGRPNVGKSTLFNKLVGKRISITEDTPGVTRDRLYQQVEWQNKYFLLMDTGGLETDSEDIMMNQISFQVDVAMETSDLILFMVDGKDGLIGLDRSIADKIHRSQKKCILVVNKIDQHYVPMSVYEFYELGFSNVLVISAEQSYGLGDLLDKIFENLPDDTTSDWEEDALKICLIGKPNVGKSSFVNAVLGEERMIVTDIPGTTRDAIDSYYERDDKKFVIIDTAGLRRQRSVDNKVEKYSVLRTYSSIDRAELCLFFVDATVGITEQDTKIAGYAHDAGKASIIVINKWDLVERETNTQRDFERMIREKMTFNPYAPVVFISIKENWNMEKLFNKIVEVDESYSYRFSTSILNKILRDATAMNPPPSDKGKRLKIFYISQVTTRPPKFLIYVNDKELCHFSYMRYLENQIRKSFPFIGTPITLEVRQRDEG